MGNTTVDTWLGGAGDWNDAANWSAGVPGPNDIVSIGTAQGISVGLTTADTIDALSDPANSSATLALSEGTLALREGGTWAGVFVLGEFSDVSAGGQPLVLSGLAALDGQISGPGTVDVTGSAEASGFVVTGSAALEVGGTIAVDGSLTLGTASGDAATLDVGAGGTFALQGDFSILSSGAAQIANAGLFELTAASGTGFVGATLANTGTIAIQGGTLSLDAGPDSLGGTISGGGELDLRGGASYTLEPGLALAVGTLGVLDANTEVSLATSPSYAGAFTLGNGTTLALGGYSFTLSGAANALDGAVAGPGTVAVQSAADANKLELSNGATLSDTGTITQDGLVNLGTGGADSAELAIAAGATYDILSNVAINGYGSAAISNAGLFEKSGADGTSVVRGTFDSSGTILVDAGTLSLFGPTGSFSGTLAGAGELDLRGGGQYTLANGTALDVGTLGVLDIGSELQIAAGFTYGGNFVLGAGASLGLGGADVSLSGQDTLDGTIIGPGTAAVSGSVEANGLTLAGGAELDVTGSVNQDGTVGLGASYTDQATLDIEIGASWDLAGGNSILGLGSVTISNAGLFENTGMDGVSVVEAQFANTGTIAVASGTLAFSGAFTNQGEIAVGGSGAAADAVIGAASLTGSGTLIIGANGTLALDGGLVGSESIVFGGSGGVLQLAEPGAVAGTMAGFTAGDTIDLVGIAANQLSYADGVLTVSEVSGSSTATIAELALPGIADPSGLALLADGTGGTEIEFAPNTDPPPTLVADNWTSAASGDWANTANWTLGTVPGPDNQAVIAPTGTAGFVVSYTTTDTVDQLTGGTVSSGAAITLSIGGGALSLVDGGSWSGSLAESGGTFDAESGFSVGSLSLGTSAIAEIDTGTLAVGGGTLAGTLTGAGLAELQAGAQATFASGVALDVATLDLAASAGEHATATLGSSLSYGGEFELAGTGASGAALVLNANSIGLDGSALLDGAIVGAGTVGVAGAADVNGLVLSGSALLDDIGTITQDGSLTLGTAATDASVLRVESGGTYDVLADVNVGASASASIENAGLFEKSGAGGATTIAAPFDNTGTVEVGSGTLELASAATLGGAALGTGTLLLGGAGTFAPGLTLGVATLEIGTPGGPAASASAESSIGYGGELALARGASLHLGGESLALNGSALLDGTIDNDGSATPGTLALSGSADANGLSVSGSVDFVDSGIVTQDGSVTLGAPANVQIGAAGTYDIVADVGIAATGSAGIENSGLLEKTGALGASTIEADLTSSGTILAARGILDLASGANETIGGTLAGAGEIELAPSGTATLTSGLVLSVATLALGGGDIVLGGNETYTGDFILAPGATLAPNGSALTLDGPATLDGEQNGGLLTVLGTAEANGLALAGGGTIDDAGVILQDGTVTLGTAAADSGTILVGSGATYDFLTDVDIDSQGTVAIVNHGLFEKTGDSGISYVFANITNVATIAVAEGTLALLSGAATLGGSIVGAGELDLDSTGTYTLESGLSLDVGALGMYGGGEVLLESSRSYAGSATLGPGTTLDLLGNSLSLGGAIGLQGTVEGPGTLDLQGNGDANGLVVSGAAVLDVTGSITEDGAITLGTGTADSAELNVASGGVYDLIADIGIAANGSAQITNAGTFEQTAATGSSTIAAAFTNTGTIAVTSGTLAFTGGLVNTGMMSVAGGELLVGQSLGADADRSGTIAIGQGGEALLDSSVSSAEAIGFDGGGATLGLAQPTAIGATISGFGAGDTIDLMGATFTSGADVVTFANHTLTISNGGGTVADLRLAGAYSASEFQLAADGANGTVITIPCFLAGTRIRTPAGEVAVERLAVGDRVLTRSGEARPIVWIGQRSIACARHPTPEKVQPVRIRAGAFAPDLPRRDLLLSPDHAVYAERVLIPVKHLINGISVRQENATRADYFHVELASHDILLGEGLPAESYLDSGNRGEFENRPAGMPIPLRGRVPADLDARRCAPLCIGGPALASVKRKLLARLAQEGWTVAEEAELRLSAAGRTILPSGGAANFAGGQHPAVGRYHFVLPDGCAPICIHSRSGVPAEIVAESEDGRPLGVAVECIVLDGREIPLENPALGRGFYGVERQGAVAWRWTDGNAELTLPSGGHLLELTIRAMAKSWRAPPAHSVRAA